MKLNTLFVVRILFVLRLFFVYDSTIRPYMEYCFHVWVSALNRYLNFVFCFCFQLVSFVFFFKVGFKLTA